MCRSGYLEASQRWLLRRFFTLAPDDFGDVRFVCTSRLDPPAGFEDVWCQGDQDLCSKTLLDVQAILCFCNLDSPSEVQVLCRLIQAVDDMGHGASPILCIPHSVAPESRPKLSDSAAANRLHSKLFELGLDGMLPVEYDNLELVFAVKAKLGKMACLSKMLDDEMQERASRIETARFLEDSISSMVWDYARARIAPIVPPIDQEIRPDPKIIDDWSIGSPLGRGMFGVAHKLHPLPSSPMQGQPAQVMKIVTKKPVADITDLKIMRRQIEIMTLISFDEWVHPNIVQFYEMHHSATQIFFRMELGGNENLYRRLNHRQKSGEGCRPFPLDRVVDLIGQMTAAIAHLHSGPRVCHRDIKPENITLTDVPGERIQVKIIDFDLAIVEAEGAVCRSPCGTLPFTAPEVLMESEYSGMVADVWSLGIVIIEIVCGLRMVEEVLHLKSNSPGCEDRPHHTIGSDIFAAFCPPGSAGNLVERRHQPELAPLIFAAVPLVNCMVCVDTLRRWSCVRAKEELRNFPSYVEA